MKFFLSLITLITTISITAQSTGSIAGKLTDTDFNNEPLPFANVLIKGTSKGTTSDADGLYEISNLDPGKYTVLYSFVGYETVELEAQVVAGKVTTINVPMGASAASLDEVVITTTVRRESEAALLLDQKKAVEIKESIGAEQLSRLGVSDASAATTKIAGVSKSEGAGQIYVRGLGDRYLSTTLNGLPIPSDNIDKKNIDLGLFPTKFIQNVSISKTFAPYNSADQASGNINIESKEITSRKDFGFSFGGGVNSNAESVYDDFKVTVMNSDVSLGIFTRPYDGSNLQNALLEQSWNTQTVDVPLNYSFGFNAGGFMDDAGKFRLYFAGGQSVDHEYREGTFRQFDRGLAGSLLEITGGARDFVPDGDNRYWRRTVNTSGMLTGQFKINDNNRLQFNAFAVNKVFEETYEAGRSGNAIFFDELTPNAIAGNQFVRDQNVKNTLLTIGQLLGNHDLSEKNKLEWALGYNRLAADEPNRIRNELNFRNVPGTPFNQRPIELGNTGGNQNSKRFQDILDEEYNGRIKDVITLKENEEGDALFKVNFGGDTRYKQRTFAANVYGLDEVTTGSINPSSIDNLNEIFIPQNISDGSGPINLVNPSRDDSYDGELLSYAGFADFIGVFGDFTAEVGVRFQKDEITVDYDVNNAPGGREGEVEKSYQRLYPALNLKYDVNDKMAIRLASSLSQTLPEFKEIAPFGYVSPLNQETRGNLNVEASRNFNVDLKFEFFPSNDELLSLTTFYKNIEDPINKTLIFGAEDVFSYFNTGDNARVFGLELEGRVYIVEKSETLPDLKLSGNVSYIDHKQDLKGRTEGQNLNGDTRTFRYRGIDEIGLEGASDWTTNVALTLNTGDKYPYEFTLAANYASDRIYALGSAIFQSPEGSTGSLLEDTNFNGEIIEKGVVVLDFVFNKDINEHWSIGASAKNLLNPVIRRYQLVASDFGNSTATQEETVLTYTRGVNASLSINYKF